MKSLLGGMRKTLWSVTMENDNIPTEIMRELEFLRWFYCEADFGPADWDVRYMYHEAYVREGNTIPKGYELNGK